MEMQGKEEHQLKEVEMEGRTMRKVIKKALIRTSEIAAAAVIVGVVACDNPAMPHKIIAMGVSLLWIALVMAANGGKL